MPDHPQDTDVLLALLSSLLDSPLADQSVLLDALVASDGSVERAAKLLSAREPPPPKTNGVKRKRRAGLDDWLDGRDSCSPAKTRTARATTPSPGSSRLPSGAGPSPNKSSPDKLARTQSPEPSSSSPRKVKAVTQDEFMAILRPPNSSDSKAPGPPRFPPLTLTSPAMVAKHTPCTMHRSVLPPELACRLFYTMINESKTWEPNKWWLFERLVESPNRSSFYVRRASHDDDDGTGGAHESAQYWYNGRPVDPPKSFPPAMAEACEYVERIVNAEMRKRPRFALEWGGEPAPGGADAPGRVVWRANVALSNRYEGAQESVGFHSDQLTNLGPYATIASVSLGTTRTFRLREVIPTDEKATRSARTYNIPLVHNSLCIMHASCQETFKHSIPPQRVIDPYRPPHPPPGLAPDAPAPTYNARINITFRFYRPDFDPSTTPLCRCGIPCILRADMKNRYTVPDAGEGKEAGEKRGKMGEISEQERTNKGLATKYWWTCCMGQSDGKGCNLWKVMDAKAEGRGPFAGDVA